MLNLHVRLCRSQAGSVRLCSCQERDHSDEELFTAECDQQPHQRKNSLHQRCGDQPELHHGEPFLQGPFKSGRNCGCADPRKLSLERHRQQCKLAIMFADLWLGSA